MLRITLLSFLLLSPACKKRPPAVTAAAASSPVTTSAPESSSPDAATLAAVEQVKANFARVHFEVDSSALGAEARAALADNARILQEHRSIRVEIQGHADERGTIDYNLALGMRRADAVARALGAMGVTDDRLRTISFGEERPLASGAGESAWSKNRRCEFRVTAGAGVTGTTEG